MAHALSSSADKGILTARSPETARLVVKQPAKMAELNKLLETFENLNARVSERSGEDASHDLGGAGTGTGGQQSGQQISPRDLAIRNMPAQAVLQKKLTRHIRAETRKLEQLARAAARSSQPGAAFTLNELYAKIRRLNSLFSEILQASVDVLRRLFVRVFIDNQPIL